MSAIKQYIVLSLLCLSAVVAGAVDVVHYPAVWVEADEVSLLASQNSLGVGGGLGAAYNLRIGPVLVNAGVGVTASYTAFKMSDAHAELPNSVDRDGYAFTFVYDVQNRRDAVTEYSVSVPLRVGAVFHPVYFLVGADFRVPLAASGKIKADITTYGDYPQFLDPFTGMPEHQYYDGASRSWEAELSPNIDVCVSAEVGYVFGQQMRDTRHMFTLGLFAEYGLMEGYNRTGMPLLTLPEVFRDDNMLAPVAPSHVVLSETKAVHRLFAGVRFAVIFPMRSRGKFNPCHCIVF